MVPGLIAGLYSRDQVAIDCAARRRSGCFSWKRRSKVSTSPDRPCCSRPTLCPSPAEPGCGRHQLALINPACRVWLRSSPWNRLGIPGKPGRQRRGISRSGLWPGRGGGALALRRRWPDVLFICWHNQIASIHGSPALRVADLVVHQPADIAPPLPLHLGWPHLQWQPRSFLAHF